VIISRVRGLLYGNFRPDLLVFDDLEDPEAMLSDEQRDKQWKWLQEDALLTVDEKGPDEDWKAVLIGTLLHEASACARILAQWEEDVKAGQEPDWHVVHLAICDEDFKSNWPEAYTDEKIKEKVTKYRRLRMMDTFAREYMNLPVSIDSNFTRDYFHTYEEPLDPQKVMNVVLMDVAKTVKADSAETAAVVVGIDVDSRRLYIRQIRHGRLHPDEILDAAFELAVHWKARTIGFEVTGLNEFITYPITNEMHRRGLSFDLIELKARGKKEDRVRTLLPFYKRGDIHHNLHGEGIEALELQLLSFPRSLKWDIMDALAYIVELLDSGELYFLPDSYTEDPEKIEDEYKELEREEGSLPPIGEEWKVA